jgi:hypothetical protein
VVATERRARRLGCRLGVGRIGKTEGEGGGRVGGETKIEDGELLRGRSSTAEDQVGVAGTVEAGVRIRSRG